MDLIPTRRWVGTQAAIHLPFFYSALFELGYEAVGELDPRLETVSKWKEPCRKGIVYYLRRARCGALFCGMSGRRLSSRALIGSACTFTSAELDSAIPMCDRPQQPEREHRLGKRARYTGFADAKLKTVLVAPGVREATGKKKMPGRVQSNVLSVGQP
jgi:hypothetical protein